MSAPDRSMGAGVVVYLGPSLPVDDARRVLPLASVRPPIALGDLLSLVDSESVPDLWAVGIVDGVFYQSLPVWHKEILHALDRGIRVFGASSMGALRAAECDAFGMVGIGDVYRDFAEGRLTGDDEVALAHGDAESGWAGATLPLVNVRATFVRAVESGRIDERTAEIVVAAAKGLWFPERTSARILRAAGEHEPGRADLAAAAEVLEREYVDVKRADAIALLQEIARRGDADDDSPAPPDPGFAFVRSQMFKSLRERDRALASADGVLRAEEISRYVALCHPGYPALRDRVLDRLATNDIARRLGVEASEEERAEEMRRFRARRLLDSEAAVDGWCARNDMTRRELDELVGREARNRKVRDWLAMCRTRRALVKPLLDELRLSGEFEAWAARAGGLHRSVPAADDAALEPGDGERTRELVRDQMRGGGWRPDAPIETWATEAGFLGVDDLVAELARHHQDRAMRRDALAAIASLFVEETAGTDAAGG